MLGTGGAEAETAKTTDLAVAVASAVEVEEEEGTGGKELGPTGYEFHARECHTANHPG